jgi:hypothetical protein
MRGTGSQKEEVVEVSRLGIILWNQFALSGLLLSASILLFLPLGWLIETLTTLTLDDKSLLLPPQSSSVFAELFLCYILLTHT